MGLKEETEFKRHVELETVSETREEYIHGNLFSLGDKVVVKESDEVGTITYLGSNYILVELSENKSVRKWLDAVEKLEEETTEIPEAETSVTSTVQPVSTGIAKAMKRRSKKYK